MLRLRFDLGWVFVRVGVGAQGAGLRVVVSGVGVEIEQELGCVLADAQVAHAHAGGAAHVDLGERRVNPRVIRESFVVSRGSSSYTSDVKERMPTKAPPFGRWSRRPQCL